MTVRKLGWQSHCVLPHTTLLLYSYWPRRLSCCVRKFYSYPAFFLRPRRLLLLMGPHVHLNCRYLSLFHGAIKNSVLFAFFSSGTRWNWVQERFPLATRLLHAQVPSAKSDCKGISSSEVAFTRFQENEIYFTSVEWRVYKSIETGQESSVVRSSSAFRC